jgi:hypothetical protein
MGIAGVSHNSSVCTVASSVRNMDNLAQKILDAKFDMTSKIIGITATQKVESLKAEGIGNAINILI